MTVYLGNKVINIRKNGTDCIFKVDEELFYARYVSLGDSIAGGHSIDGDWAVNYGVESQYGENGNTETEIVPNSYTNLIHKEMPDIYPKKITATSFARSGDAVTHLMDKLNHDVVRNAIKKAEVVTICIGANDILGHVYPELMPYVETGDLSSLEAKVERSLNVLATDSEPNSYVSLFNKLNAINPKAKYIFTTVYNPYKYLWIEEGRNGFFKPILDAIPQMNIRVDEYIEDTFLGGQDWLPDMSVDVDNMIKDGLLSTYYVQLLFDRINGLSGWVEKYVEGNDSFDGLNRILRRKINEYQSINPNFSVAETKTLFDTYPDRTVTADVHYNDLVNVEFTRGYDTMQMDWGQLYDGDPVGFWTGITAKHTHWSNAFPSTNPMDYVSFDLEGLAEDLVTQIVEKVIVPDIDPHPETYGHYVLKQSFAGALGW